jgi:GT2 family glycosyltransferase
MAVKLSVIIVSYNVRDLIIQCLQSVFRDQVKNDIEVIVIDNNSSDDSLVQISSLFPQVNLIENKQNVGFSEANNQGLRIARGHFIFLLNPDTELFENTLALLELYLEKHPQTSIVVPRLLNSDKSIQESAWKNAKLLDLFLDLFFLHGVYKVKAHPVAGYDVPTEIETASGAALFFRKELPAKVGELDKTLFWMEDVDYCYRARRVGNIIYLPQALVIHHSGKSTKTDFRIPISNQIISKIKYFKKNDSFLTFSAALVLSYLNVFSRIAVFLCLSPFQKLAKHKLYAYVYTFRKLNRYVFLSAQNVV